LEYVLEIMFYMKVINPLSFGNCKGYISQLIGMYFGFMIRVFSITLDFSIVPTLDMKHWVNHPTEFQMVVNFRASILTYTLCKEIC